MTGDRVIDGAGAAVEPSTAFCDQCGRPGAEPGHDRCAVRRAMEPPRFCADCGRRMVVQVDPFGWTARCSRHGERRG